MNQRAVVILSGGLDSATAMALAMEKGYHVVDSIWFEYGQRHELELGRAGKLAASHMINGPTLVQIPRVFADNQLSSSGLTPRLDTPMSEITDGVAPTFVPGRNMIMLALAAAYAVKQGCETIVGGWHWDDSSGYPDCRKVFLDSMQKTITYALGDEYRMQIEAPLISMSKSQIVSNAVRLGVPIEDTWSCYNPQNYVGFYDLAHMWPVDPERVVNRQYEGPSACGRCDSCLLRIKGFKDAGFIDPIPYAIDIDWSGCDPVQEVLL